jgi:hypothetical protein
MIVVKQYEAAVIFRDGKLYQVLPAGRHSLSRMPLIGRLEEVWVSLRSFKSRITAKSLTIDGADTTVHCTSLLEIESPQTFIMSVVGAHQEFDQAALDDWLVDFTQSIMRGEIARRGLREVYLERDNFISAMRVRLLNEYHKFGMRLDTFEVTDVEIPQSLTEKFAAPLMGDLSGQAVQRELKGVAGGYRDLRQEAQVDPIAWEAVHAMQDFARRPPAQGSLVSGDVLMPLVLLALLRPTDPTLAGVSGELRNVMGLSSATRIQDPDKAERALKSRSGGNNLPPDIKNAISSSGIDSRELQTRLSNALSNPTFANWITSQPILKCKNCGHMNRLAATFCTKCGKATR